MVTTVGFLGYKAKIIVMEKRFSGYNLFIALAAIFLYSGFFSAIPAIAMDYLFGHVISVDQKNNRFVLQIDQVADEAFHCEASIPSQQNNLSAADKDEPRLITVIVSEEAEIAFLPGCVRDGELVRVWGKNVGGKESAFQAVDVRGTRGWRKDKSGVRSRLGRGRHFREERSGRWTAGSRSREERSGIRGNNGGRNNVSRNNGRSR